jgi:lipopolysaccharide transport system ATP-binding protein
MCNKAVMMEAGRIVASGPVDEICDRYHKSVHVVTRANSSTDVVSAGLSFTGMIGDVGLGDRLVRASGAVRFTYVMSKDADNNPKWSFRPGDTVRLCFKYEVIDPVDSLMFGLRLYLPSFSASGQDIVTDIREVLSSRPLESGQVGSIDLTLPSIELMPNRFLIYAFLKRKEGGGGFDIIDQNVGLPALTIDSDANDPTVQGVVSLDYATQRSLSEKSREPLETKGSA